MVTAKNWAYSGYTLDELKVSLSFFGEIDSKNKYIEGFYVNKSCGDVVVHQERFDTVTEAIDSVNRTYEHWDFYDQSIKENNTGCDSCSAH